VAERAFGRKLAASCRTSLAAYAVARDGALWLRGFIASRDGRRALRGERSMAVADMRDAEALGEALGDEFIERGAAAILAEEH
jgi:hydroxymethylbilane synthase